MCSDVEWNEAVGIEYDVLCDPSTAIQFFVGPIDKLVQNIWDFFIFNGSDPF